ncbi:MAG: hypothetical protein HY898_03080 [Deltaproteobacteria bacterium]|nr:hypothetical protein [Deltaproteobacteria bacterium]
MYSPAPSPFFLGLLRGYDRKSLLVLIALVGSGLVLGHDWSEVFPSAGRVDILLAVMWAWLALALPWRVNLAQDLVMLGFGLVGGALIETWGTWTGVWWYFTAERPPWWVIPAWAMTALAGQRAALLILEVGRRAAQSLPLLKNARAGVVLYWLVLPAFAIAMTRFSLRAASLPAVAIAFVTMAVIILSTRTPRNDVIAFLAGSLLGAFIEPWGTGHRCWTYYTLETPPLVAVFAHGFATLAFLRATDTAQRLWAWNPFRSPRLQGRT